MFYRSGDKMMAVEVATQPSFTVSKPTVLFEASYFREGSRPAYDVTADGQRFLMIKAGESETAVTQFNVVVDWFEELKRRVPVGQRQ